MLMNLIYDTNVIHLHRFLFLVLYLQGVSKETSQIKKKKQTYDR